MSTAAIDIIDSALARTAKCSLFSSDEIRDLLLDLRLVLDPGFVKLDELILGEPEPIPLGASS